MDIDPRRIAQQWINPNVRVVEQFHKSLGRLDHVTVDSAPQRTSDPLDALGEAAAILRPVTASERVAAAIRQNITDGRLHAGIRLTEATVASLLDVSRNTVREAFVMLANERLVQRHTNRGVFVVTPTAEMVLDLYRMRILSEAAAIAWGEAFTDQRVAALREAVTRGQEARDRQDWEAVALANREFHRGLAAFSGSERAMKAFETNLAEMQLVFQATGDTSFQGPFVDENDRVCTLLEAGEREEAAAVLRDYLGRARDVVLARMGSA